LKYRWDWFREMRGCRALLWEDFPGLVAYPSSIRSRSRLLIPRLWAIYLRTT
jgi:hypothetical protein